MSDTLIRTKNGVSISQNDPLFWEKYLRFEPQNPEAMYQVAKNLEKESEAIRLRYLEQQKPYLMQLYQQKQNKSKRLMEKAWWEYRYEPAKEYIEKKTEEKNTDKQKNKSYWPLYLFTTFIFYVIFAAGVLFGILIF